MSRRTLILAFACALAAQPAAAREYFVSPAGNDAGAATIAAPWRSVEKVNATTFAAGDVIRFAGGGVWNRMLSPRGNGTAAAPIVFTTYGTGRAIIDGAGGSGYAGIEVYGRSFVAFEHLTLRNWGNGNQAVYLAGAQSVRFTDIEALSSAEGFHQSPSAPSVGVIIEHSRISGIAAAGGTGVGINVTTGSSGWRVTDTVIEHVADSCVIDQGAGSVYERMTVTDCGFGGITYGTHGLYLKGAGQTLRDSTVAGAYTNCVSIRFQDATVSGNALSGCPIAIGWFEDTTTQGNVTITRNRISDVRTAIYVDTSPSQAFRISHNTILGGRKNGAETEGIVTRNARGLAITNNILTGALFKAIDVSGTPAAAYDQRGNNLSAPGADFVWNGKFVSTAAAFNTLTGKGAGDTTTAPSLVAPNPAAPDLHLTAASAVRDRGVTTPSGLTLNAGCDGAPTTFCGTAPEPGAHELLDGTPGGGGPVDGGGGAGEPPPAGVPSAPEGLSAALSGTTVTLAWKAPSAGAAKAYNVTANRATTQTVTTLRATVAGLKVGSTYTFRVTATDGAGSTSPAAVIRVRVVRTPKISELRPRVVASGRHHVVVRIPKAVVNGTLIVGGKRIRVRPGLVRVRGLGAGRAYTVRVAVRLADGRRLVSGAVVARTR